MKYVDASAVLRVLFAEPGPSVPLLATEHVVSSQLIEVEAFRAVDRERLLGGLNDAETAIKRKELTELLVMTDLAPVDDAGVQRAKSSFAVNLRAIDSIHGRYRGNAGRRRRRGTAVVHGRNVKLSSHGSHFTRADRSAASGADHRD